MRLFVAVYLPRDLAQEVWKAGEVVEGRWRREPLEKLHITLKYIGEVSEEKKREIDEVLRSIPFEPFQVEVRGAGVFPHPRNPRVIWIGARSEELAQLQERIEKALEGLGIPRERRGFIPHITLGRAKGFVDARRFLEEYGGRYLGSFQVKEFVLVRSHLTPEGSRYEVVERYG